MISTEISKGSDVKDAKKILQKGKERVESPPVYIITDVVCSYKPAYKIELDVRRTTHIKTKSLSEGFANRLVERWDNEIREITKTRRGLGNDESAQVVIDLIRINHNYYRANLGLPNKITPAEAASNKKAW